MSDRHGRHRRDEPTQADENEHIDDRTTVVDDAYAYAMDGVGDAERLDIEDRLARSDEPTRAWFDSIVASVHETMALTASSTAAEPPSTLRASILAAIDSTEQAGTAPLQKTRPDDSPSEALAPVVSLDARRRKRFRVLAAAAAVLVVVGVGGGVITQQLDGAPSSATSQVLAAGDVATSTVDVEGGGTATVRWSRAENAAVITLDGLAEPGPGKVFEMWLIGEDPAPRPVGLVADGSAQDLVVTGLNDATTWAVTVEPDTGSDAPTTTPIAAVTLDA